jgi:hypothetical protein
MPKFPWSVRGYCGAGALSVAAAIAAIVGCIAPRQDYVRIDPALAALVPNDATLLFGARIESLKDTYLWKTYVVNDARPGLLNLTKITGLDARQDIYETLFASDGKNPILMARGKFSPEGGLEPRLEIPNAKRTQYKTYTLIGSDEMAVVFMNPSVAVGGPVPALKAMIDSRGKSAGISPAMTAAVNSIPASNQLWAVSSKGFGGLDMSSQGRQGVPGQLIAVLQFLKDVDSFRLMADLRSGLNLKLLAECTSDDGARRLNDGLRGLIGFARLQTPDNQPDLLRAYDGVQVSHSSRALTVTVDLAQEQLQQLGNELSRLGGGSRAGAGKR